MKPIIGIEVHVELATKSKMFCACSANHFGQIPNSLTCPVCLGLPGALPVPNQKAVDWTMMIGLALGASINLHSKFDRKHYFYPDLPKGYQISQYDEPLSQGGFINTLEGKVDITRVHLEEDTGKLQHKVVNGQKVSLVDFNRSGVPLVEIVSEPQIHSSAQAKEYAKNLATVIRFLGVSDADMEKGSMRLEANISWGMDLGYKVEVKNINSFNYLQKAIDYELNRQQKLLDQGKTPVQETRGYNENKGITFSQRTKEEAMDYRYFPEPDIPPLEFTQAHIDQLSQKLPELPWDTKARWQQDFNLSDQYYDVLLANPQIANLADSALKATQGTKISPDAVAGAIVNKKVDITKVKPQEIVKQLSEKQNQVTDTKQLSQWIDSAIADNPNAVSDYYSGKESALQFLLGQVMKLSRGQASPSTVLPLLKKQLSS